MLRPVFILGVLLALAGCGAWQDVSADDDGTAGGDRTRQPPGPESSPSMPATSCANPPVSSIAIENRCAVTKRGNGGLLIQGTLLLPQEVLENGQLLIVGERIACASCDCSEHPAFSAATAVSCPRGVISPGLINTHDHLGWTRSRPVRATARYDHRHQWRKGLDGKPKIPAWNVDWSEESIAWGEVRMILGGATSIMGEGSAKGLLRNLDWYSDNGGLDRPSVKNTTFPLGDKDGQLLAQQCSYPTLPEVETVQQAIAWVPHVAEGVNQQARNEFSCLSGSQPGAVDVILPNTSYIHAVGITAEDARRIAQAKARVIWSPRSNISLYGHTADVTLLHNLGVRIALGTDWVISGSMNPLRELACADHLNRVHYDRFFSDAQLWQMVTQNAAISAGLDDVIGRLEPGYLADVTIFDGQARGAHAAVVRATVKEVVLVLRGGRALYGDDDLVKELIPTHEQARCESIDLCQRQKRLCLERETGKQLADLEAGLAGGSYPLFFCGPPEDEPSCIPSRPGQYDGAPTASDGDGDGVPDPEDSCPKIFNPPRPVDQMVQPDADGDTVGDSCDGHPFDPSRT